MVLREWPLVVFTLLGQLAVGGYLVLALPLLLARRLAAPDAGRDARLDIMLAATGLLTAALLAAFFHLGAPLNAPNALNNLRRSWLSREIFFLLLTLALWAALTLLIVFKTRSSGLIMGLAVASGASAAGLIFCMARLYMLPAVKAWNVLFTPASFFLTAFLLGATAGTAAAWAGGLRLQPSHVRALVLAAVLLTAAGLILAALAAPHFGLFGPVAPPGLKPPPDPSLLLFAGRLVLLCSGAALLVLQLKRAVSLPATALPVVMAAFLCLFAAETLGRFLFFSLK